MGFCITSIEDDYTIGLVLEKNPELGELLTEQQLEFNRIAKYIKVAGNKFLEYIDNKSIKQAIDICYS
jgi:hypothetical protein